MGVVDYDRMGTPITLGVKGNIQLCQLWRYSTGRRTGRRYDGGSDENLGVIVCGGARHFTLSFKVKIECVGRLCRVKIDVAISPSIGQGVMIISIGDSVIITDIQRLSLSIGGGRSNRPLVLRSVAHELPAVIFRNIFKITNIGSRSVTVLRMELGHKPQTVAAICVIGSYFAEKPYKTRVVV